MTHFEKLLELRAKYPPKMTPPQIGELLNSLAWTYRDEGMRLLGKLDGNNCPMPNGTLISTDYIVHEPTLTGHDVLSGRDDGTTQTVAFEWGPGREPLAEKITSGARSLVAPVAPSEEEEPVDGNIQGTLDALAAGQIQILEMQKDLAQRIKEVNDAMLQRTQELMDGKIGPDYEGVARGSARIFGASIPVTVTVRSKPVIKE